LQRSRRCPVGLAGLAGPLNVMESIGSPLLWTAFTAGILALLALDLGVFHRTAHEVRFREALVWSIVWVALSAAFGGWVYVHFGAQRGLEFFTGYLIEKALSVDNIFVFLVVFSQFGVPRRDQHRVLYWGILGALVMRAVFIFAGAALLSRFHVVIYLFGALLVWTGVKMFRAGHEPIDLERNVLYRIVKRVVPAVSEYHGGAFFVRQRGRWMATPLLLALAAIEATDLVFAVDSIPAIFAVSRDPFIVYTSNIFAILGLRAMFFLLAGVMDKFTHLKTGLALVLVFVGAKMLAADVFPLPIGVSLGVVAALIGGSILWSFRDRRHLPDAGRAQV
jgi:tellurite resistance protein TerC